MSTNNPMCQDPKDVRARLARKARADAAVLAEQTRAYARHRAS